jgi:hypothetical protein
VQTPSHAYWTWRLTRERPVVGWRVLGAVTPDLPGFALAAGLLAQRRRDPDDAHDACPPTGPAQNST